MDSQSKLLDFVKLKDFFGGLGGWGSYKRLVAMKETPFIKAALDYLYISLSCCRHKHITSL